MEFRVLGAVGILEGDRALPLGGGMPRRLLAVLLAHRNEVVSADRLIEVLWSVPPDSAVATLQSYVSRLRRFTELAGDRVDLVNRAPGYVLEVPDDLVDAGRFELGLGRGQELLVRDPAAALVALDAALAEWRGTAFAEFAEAEWIQTQAIRLEELRLVATELRVEAGLRVGRHDELVGLLEAFVLDHPLRERARRQLMLALYRSGRQAEALRAGYQFRTILGEQLGLEPPVEFRELESAILEERDELAWVAPPPSAAAAAAASVAPSGLGRRAIPAETTPLVGRERDLELAGRLLDSGRIFTLFGPGGVGKTRLAHRLATDVAANHLDGVRLVELAPLSDAGAVTAAVADALDVQQRANRSLADSIVELLGAQRLLLVLDNCEHVLDTTSELVELILRWCPNVHVLATSREPLGIPGEVVWSVPPLPVPASREEPVTTLVDVPSVQLFTERARAARPDFELDDTNHEAVAEICIRLDGVPLALELAAATMRSMSPEQLAERLPERFRVLAGSRRSTDPRHRTLRDLVHWSYELLDPTEQCLFARVSVFAGPFTIERAERVCAGDGIDAVEVAGLLSVLVDKSMLVAEARGSRTVFRQLETLRAFGREQLEASPEASTVRLEHARAHVELAEQAGVGLNGPDEARWAQEVDASFDDLREAHGNALADGHVDLAVRLVVGPREYAWRAIRYELLTWAEVTAPVPGAAEQPLFPVLLGVLAYGRFVRGEVAEAIDEGERAVEVAARTGWSTAALAERAMANAAFYLRRVDQAMELAERMRVIAHELDEPSLEAHALYMRSVATTSVGDPAGGAAFAERSATLAARSGSPTAQAQADYASGLSLVHSDPVRALRFLDRSVQNAEAVGNRWIRAFALTESLSIRARQGDPAEALRAYYGVIDTWFRGGDWANLWLSLRHVFAIFEAVGQDDAAAAVAGALDESGVMNALPFEPGSADEVRLAADRLRARMGEQAFGEAEQAGRAMRDEEVVRHVLANISAGT